VHNDHDDRYDEQKVDQSAADVKGQEAEQPENNKNSSDDAEHVIFLDCRGC
jgi:hypothetical protein